MTTKGNYQLTIRLTKAERELVEALKEYLQAKSLGETIRVLIYERAQLIADCLPVDRSDG